MNQTAKTKTEPEWHDVLDAALLERKGRAVVRVGRRQVALFQRNGQVLACNNRCPHEGYPLSEGTLDGGSCMLTCNWHNWKFDLASGRNLMGFDDLPVHPTKTIDGRVWVALTEEPAEARLARAQAALRAAYDEHDYERIARELARLARAGGDPRQALAETILWSHAHFEFGMTHAYAAAADWLALHDAPGTDATTRLACLTEAIGHIAWDALRHRAYPYAKRKRAWHEARFLAAIEAEDEALAIAYVRGALGSGMTFGAIERALATAALRHYCDFGHALIYVHKAGALVDRLGPHVALPLALALVRAFVFASREDMIPEFRSYAGHRAAWGKPNGAAHSADAFGLGVDQAMAWTVAVSSNHGPASIHRSLLRVGARNLSSFDTRLEGRWDNAVSTNVGWLDFTHALTFGHAVAALAASYPELWPDGLLQMACFAGRNAGFVETGERRANGQDIDRPDFWRWARDQVLDHGHRDYIFAAHRIKTYSAVKAMAGDDPADDVLLMALRRYLAARPKEKHVRRVAKQALGFVAREN